MALTSGNSQWDVSSSKIAPHVDSYKWRCHKASMSTRCHIIVNHLWPLLLTWFNFNPSMDK